MIGALFSTVAAHLNLGSAYMVNDFWRRFVRPRASDRELIWVGRGAMALLLFQGCALAPHLRSAKAAFDLMLLIGAGTGPVFLLRWFWMRINAWAEIAGMVVSFVCALVLQFGFPTVPSWQKMLVTIALTTVGWLAVTFLTAPTDATTAARFKAAVRVNGRDVGLGLVLTAVSAFALFDMIYMVGAWIYGWHAQAAVATALAAVSGAVVWKGMRRL